MGAALDFTRHRHIGCWVPPLEDDDDRIRFTARGRTASGKASPSSNPSHPSRPRFPRSFCVAAARVGRECDLDDAHARAVGDRNGVAFRDAELYRQRRAAAVNRVDRRRTNQAAARDRDRNGGRQRGARRGRLARIRSRDLSLDARTNIARNGDARIVAAVGFRFPHAGDLRADRCCRIACATSTLTHHGDRARNCDHRPRLGSRPRDRASRSRRLDDRDHAARDTSDQAHSSRGR